MVRVLFLIGEKGKARVVNSLVGGSVLDVACATGTLLAVAFAKGLQCYGIDHASGMIDESRNKMPSGVFNIPSFYAIPYPHNTFSHVVETNAVSGVAIDVQRVIAEMVRVCLPGG